MFDPKDFPFNADKMAEFFKTNDFASGFAAGKMSGHADDLIASQKKNMEALVEANKAAATSYQALFGKQLEVFEKTMSEAKSQVESSGAGLPDAEKLAAQGEVAKAAFETALKNMGSMAEEAQKANTDAMEIVMARVQESVAELQELADKLTK